MKRKPPVPVIKFRNGCSIEECQPMKLNECISGVASSSPSTARIRYIITPELKFLLSADCVRYTISR
jgi:hypothetical protein